MQLHRFNSAGVGLNYIAAGRGASVVLVHSYTSSLEEQWERTGILDALAQHYRAIAFDLRGHGESDKPHDPAAYGAEMTWDIVRLLDHLGIARAHAVGYSLGAHILAQLLMLAPQRLITATLGGGAGRLAWTEADDVRTEIEAEEMERGRLDTQLLRLAPAGAPRPGAAELAEISAHLLEGKDRYALAAIRRANKAQVVSVDAMAGSSVPVLGIVGGEDRYVADFEKLKHAMPQLKLVVLEGATHHSAAGAPEFLNAVLKFLREHAVSDRA